LPPAQGEMLGTALQAASARGRNQIVQRLLKYGANVNTQRGDYGITLQQLEHAADVNTQGGVFGIMLRAASAENHDQIMQ
jgi:hypothetical protein